MSDQENSSRGWFDAIIRQPHNWFEEHPYIVVAVEQIPRWYSISESHGRVRTIRTVGIVRQLPNDQYVLESLDDEQSPTQVRLSRDINLTTQVPRISCTHYLNQDVPIDKSSPLSTPQAKMNEMKQSLTCFCSERVVYMPAKRIVTVNSYREVLGRISWANNEPFIDVHYFIEVQNLESLLKLHSMLYKLSRPYMHLYFVLPDEEASDNLCRRTA